MTRKHVEGRVRCPFCLCSFPFGDDDPDDWVARHAKVCKHAPEVLPFWMTQVPPKVTLKKGK